MCFSNTVLMVELCQCKPFMHHVLMSGVDTFTATLATTKSTSPRPEKNIAEIIIRKEGSFVAHVHE